MTATLNSLPGYAAYAISSLLWSKLERFDKFQPIIEFLVHHEDPATRQGISEAVIAVFQVQEGAYSEQAKKWLFDLAQSDERIARYPRIMSAVASFWKKDRNAVLKILKQLFYSSDEKSAETGAFMITNLFIVMEDYNEELYQMIFSKKLSPSQVQGCFGVTVDLMEESSCYERTKIVVEELLTYPNDSLSRLFYQSSFAIPRDIELIKKIVSIDPVRAFGPMMHFIKKNGIAIIDFAEIFLKLCSSYAQKKDVIFKEGYYSIESELPAAIVKLYDEAENDEDLRSKCLDMWDFLYKSSIHNIVRLSQLISDH